MSKQYRGIGTGVFPIVCFLCGSVVLSCASTAVKEARQAHDLGLRQMSANDYDGAIDALERARKLLGTASGRGWGRVLTLRTVNGLALGNAYRHQGDLVRARRAYREALPDADKLRQTRLKAALLNNLASLELAARETDEAERLWRVARRAALKAEDRRLLAQICNGLGSCKLDRLAINAARREFNQARDHARAVGATADGLLALNGLARVADRVGDRPKASRMFAAALRVATDKGLTSVALTTRINSAVSALRIGAFQRALILLEEAHATVDEVPDRSKRATLLHNLGGVYLAAGLTTDALAYYQQANKLVSDPSFRLSLAAAHYATGQLDAAEKELGRASSAVATEDELRRRLAWYRALLAHRRQRYAEAGRDLEGACAHVGKNAGYPRAVDCTFMQAVLSLEDRTRLQQAVSMGRKAVDGYRRRGDPHGVLRSRLVVARALQLGGSRGRALQAYTEAADELERLWPELGSDRLKVGFVSSKAQLFTQVLSLLSADLPAGGAAVRRPVAERVLDFIERSRSRGLLDLIAQGKLQVVRRADPALRRAYERKLLAVQTLQTRLARTGDKRVEQQLHETVRRLDTLRLQMIASLPDAGRVAAPPRVDLSTLQEVVKARGLATVSYYLDGDLGLVLTVAPEGLQLRRLSDPRGVAERARGLVRLIRTRYQGEEARRAFADTAHALYEALLAPEAKLVKDRPLVVSAHGALLELPFHVLLSKSPSTSPKDKAFYAGLDYLVHRNRIVYAPSLSVWRALVQVRPGAKRSVARALQYARLLGLGDPRWKPTTRLLPGGDGPQKMQGPPTSAPTERALPTLRQLLRGQKIDPLPHARAEVADIAAAFPAGQSHAFFGKDATEARLKRAVATRPYDVLHMATHGLVDQQAPQFSALLLAPDTAEDGLLGLVEIYGLPLQSVKLVVLSACDSALGREVAGEGIVGLVRGFLSAGANNVIASLWKVSDESTRILMTDLYRSLRQGVPVATALQKSLGRLARGSVKAEFADPYYWAPFSLYGAGDR